MTCLQTVNTDAKRGRLNRRLAALLLATSALTAVAGAANAQSTEFTNGSFESGDLTGWTIGGGSWHGGAYPAPEDYLPGGVNYGGPGPAGVTNVGTDPRTDGNLNMVFAGAHSAVVNDSSQNYSVSVISQRVNGYSANLIAFSYAAVLESSHGTTDSDAFIITLEDATTHETLFSYNLNSATAPGLFTQSSSGWYYSAWISQSVDVSARVGHDFILSLLANDCPYGGHAGYAYLDGFGSTQGGGGTGGGTSYLHWDGDGANAAANNVVDGGDGVWTTTSTNFTDAGGATNAAQTPQPGSVVFGGTAGTVTVSNGPTAQVTVSGMSFTTGGYVIQGGDIALSGADDAFDVGGNNDGQAYTATINSALTGASALTKTGVGTLILGGTNTYAGGTTVTGGTLVGSAASFGPGAITDNSALVINQPTAATMANALNGTGSLTKRGAGTLTLTAVNGLSGPTTVEAGRLQVDGSLNNSTVTVQTGGTLGGYGSVGAVVAQSGGRVAPGGSIGTLTVAGNYSAASGSVFEVEANAAGAADLLQVGGTTTISPGALLQVVRVGATPFVLGTRYTVLTSTGNLTGNFTATGDTRVSAFIDVVPHYDSHHVFLDVTQTRALAAAGDTRNQRAAAFGADTGSGPLFTHLVYLQTDAEARTAFDSISGEIHATVAGAGMDDSRFVREAVYDRLHTAPAGDGEHAAWGRIYGSWGQTDGDGNAARADRDIGGFLVGGEVFRGDGWRVGVLGGYSHSTVDVNARASSAKTDDYQLGVYGGSEHGPVDLRFGGSYAVRRIKTDRHVAFTGFTDHLNASYDASVAQVFGEVGYKVDLGRVKVEPFAGAALVAISTDGFQENGGISALTGRRKTQSVGFTTLGVRGSTDVTVGKDSTVTLTGQLGWRHAAGDTPAEATQRFSTGPNFTVAGPPLARDALVMEAGIDGKLGAAGGFTVSYSGVVGDGVSDHGVKATLRMTF
jgi:outer membrane autotransporter protein